MEFIKLVEVFHVVIKKAQQPPCGVTGKIASGRNFGAQKRGWGEKGRMNERTKENNNFSGRKKKVRRFFAAFS